MSVISNKMDLFNTRMWTSVDNHVMNDVEYIKREVLRTENSFMFSKYLSTSNKI